MKYDGFEEVPISMETFCRGMIDVCSKIIDDEMVTLNELSDGDFLMDQNMSFQYAKAIKEVMEIKDFYLTILEENEQKQLKPTHVSPYTNWRK